MRGNETPAKVCETKHYRVTQEVTLTPWTVRLHYEVDVSNLRFDMDRVRSVTFGQLGPPDRNSPYLQPEAVVESDHAELLAAFAEVFPRGIDPSTPACEVAWTIYTWVVAKARYETNAARGRASKVYGALDLLRSGRGECADYAALFVALCRIAGIPARSVVGFWATRDRGPHAWAEFQLPGLGWLPVDPARGDGGSYTQQRHFVNLSDLNQRIVVTLAYDQHLPDRRLDFLQTFSYWYRHSGPPLSLEAVHRFVVD